MGIGKSVFHHRLLNHRVAGAVGLVAASAWMTSSVAQAYTFKAADYDGVVNIGVAGPFTGAYAPFGEQLKRGAEQAARDINAAGKGGLKIKDTSGQTKRYGIRLVLGDDACEPKQAVTVANRLVNSDGVKAVIGHFCSSSSIPASDVYGENGVLMMTPASTNVQVTERGVPTVLRMCGRDDQQSVVAARFINETLVERKQASSKKAGKAFSALNVAVIHDKDTYGKGLAQAVRDLIKDDSKAKVVMFEGLTRGEKDFSALVTKVKAAGAEVVYFGGLHSEAGPLLKQLKEQGVSAPFISGDGIASEDFIAVAGGKKMVDGVYMTFGKDPRTLESGKALIKRFEANNYKAEAYTLYSYASMQAVAKAFEQTALDGEAAAEWLKSGKNSVATVLGPKSWNKKGDLTTIDYVMYKWDKSGSYNEYKM